MNGIQCVDALNFFITEPLACTDVPGGFSMAFDGGQKSKDKIEYHRVKFLYEKWGIYVSTMVHAHHITYKEGDELAGGAGLALAASKGHAFNALQLNQDQVTDLCMSFSADGAYQEGKLDVINKSIEMWNFNSYFASVPDVLTRSLFH